MDLLTHADALVENFRPGTLERWSLGPEMLLERHPRLVILRVSGFGQTGPYRHRSGFGTVAEAMSGFVALNGFPETPPLLPPMPLADEVAGLTGALSVLAAIHRRAGSGRGQVIDVSLYEPLYRLLIPYVTEYARLGLVGTRMGNAFSDAAPRNLYRSGDGTWIAVSATSQRVFERLAAAIGRADLLDDERFRDNGGRARHREQLDAIIAEWMAKRSEREILSHLQDSGAVAGPVYDAPRILTDPHYAARQDVITVPDPVLGDLPMVGITPKFSETPGAVTHAGPSLGAHNREIYRTRLGLDDAALARLAEEGVV
jgi:crotonobetainyl-CoA:carnitine CoA-transferase CaiB-like acyl-CoA transferase